MITKSKQVWKIGNQVKVGFLTLTVVRPCHTPNDFAPDAYVLCNAKQDQLYKFVPHCGLEKISIDEANDLIGESILFEKNQATLDIFNAQRAPITSRLIQG